MTTPTSRTLALLKRSGWRAQVVERWNPHARIRQDLFGFIDIVAIRANRPGVLAIQATSTPNISARIKKSRGLPELDMWLASGNRFYVVGWSKRGKVNERKLWKVKIIQLRRWDEVELVNDPLGVPDEELDEAVCGDDIEMAVVA